MGRRRGYQQRRQDAITKIRNALCEYAKRPGDLTVRRLESLLEGLADRYSIADLQSMLDLARKEIEIASAYSLKVLAIAQKEVELKRQAWQDDSIRDETERDD